MKTEYRHYANFDHAEWLEKNLVRQISPLGKKVANILGYVGGGLYNCPIDIEKISWQDNDFIEVPWQGRLSNFDGASLSRLWIRSHRELIRVEISTTVIGKIHDFDEDEEENPGKSYCLLLLFTQRESREGSIITSIPDCEKMIKDCDDDFNIEKVH